jgi:hypothetical protein
LYFDGTDQSCAWSSSCDIGRKSNLGVQAKEDELVERDVRFAINGNIADSLIAGINDPETIAHEQFPRCSIHDLVDRIDNEVFVWWRSWFLDAWYSRKITP